MILKTPAKETEENDVGNANVEIKCPHCPYTTGFRFNPGNPYEAGEFDLATHEVAEEHPEHGGKSWKFRQEKTA